MKIKKSTFIRRFIDYFQMLDSHEKNSILRELIDPISEVSPHADEIGPVRCPLCNRRCVPTDRPHHPRMFLWICTALNCPIHTIMPWVGGDGE